MKRRDFIKNVGLAAGFALASPMTTVRGLGAESPSRIPCDVKAIPPGWQYNTIPRWYLMKDLKIRNMNITTTFDIMSICKYGELKDDIFPNNLTIDIEMDCIDDNGNYSVTLVSNEKIYYNLGPLLDSPLISRSYYPLSQIQVFVNRPDFNFRKIIDPDKLIVKLDMLADAKKSMRCAIPNCHLTCIREDYGHY